MAGTHSCWFGVFLLLVCVVACVVVCDDTNDDLTLSLSPLVGDGFEASPVNERLKRFARLKVIVTPLQQQQQQLQQEFDSQVRRLRQAPHKQYWKQSPGNTLESNVLSVLNKPVSVTEGQVSRHSQTFIHGPSYLTGGKSRPRSSYGKSRSSYSRQHTSASHQAAPHIGDPLGLFKGSQTLGPQISHRFSVRPAIVKATLAKYSPSSIVTHKHQSKFPVSTILERVLKKHRVTQTSLQHQQAQVGSSKAPRQRGSPQKSLHKPERTSGRQRQPGYSSSALRKQHLGHTSPSSVPSRPQLGSSVKPAILLGQYSQQLSPTRHPLVFIFNQDQRPVQQQHQQQQQQQKTLVKAGVTNKHSTSSRLREGLGSPVVIKVSPVHQSHTTHQPSPAQVTHTSVQQSQQHLSRTQEQRRQHVLSKLRGTSQQQVSQSQGVALQVLQSQGPSQQQQQQQQQRSQLQTLSQQPVSKSRGPSHQQVTESQGKPLQVLQTQGTTRQRVSHSRVTSRGRLASSGGLQSSSGLSPSSTSLGGTDRVQSSPPLRGTVENQRQEGVSLQHQIGTQQSISSSVISRQRQPSRGRQSPGRLSSQQTSTRTTSQTSHISQFPGIQRAVSGLSFFQQAQTTTRGVPLRQTGTRGFTTSVASRGSLHSQRTSGHRKRPSTRLQTSSRGRFVSGSPDTSKSQEDLDDDTREQLLGLVAGGGGALGRLVATGRQRSRGSTRVGARRDFSREDLTKEDFTEEDLTLEKFSGEDLTREDHTLEDFTREDHTLEDLTREDHTLEDFTREDHTLEDLTRENHTLEDLTREDHTLEDFTREDYTLEDFTREDHTPEDFTREDHTLEDFTLEDFTREDHTLEDFTREDHTLEDFTREDHTLEDFTLEDLTREDHTLEDLTREDHTLEDFTREDHTLEDFTLEDLTREDHTLEDLTREDHTLEDFTREDHTLEDLTREDHTDFTRGNFRRVDSTRQRQQQQEQSFSRGNLRRVDSTRQQHQQPRGFSRGTSRRLDHTQRQRQQQQLSGRQNLGILSRGITQQQDHTTEDLTLESHTTEDLTIEKHTTEDLTVEKQTTEDFTFEDLTGEVLTLEHHTTEDLIQEDQTLEDNTNEPFFF